MKTGYELDTFHSVSFYYFPFLQHSMGQFNSVDLFRSVICILLCFCRKQLYRHLKENNYISPKEHLHQRETSKKSKKLSNPSKQEKLQNTYLYTFFPNG